jgi:hypothetical protein
VKPLNVQTVDLVFVDFIAMEATFGFKERGRFVKGPYALIPLGGDAARDEGADPAALEGFLEVLKDFIGHIHRCEEPRQAANLATAVLANLANPLQEGA